jgi:hypothetical protein
MRHPIADYVRIEKLAYALWQDRGRPSGSPEVDWLAAEAALHPLGHESPELPVFSLAWAPDQSSPATEITSFRYG